MKRNGFNISRGDLVRIREWDDMAKEFPVTDDGSAIVTGTYDFVSGMRWYSGKIVRAIFDPIDDPSVVCYVDGFAVSIEMVEPIDEMEDYSTDDNLIDFLNNYTVGGCSV